MSTNPYKLLKEILAGDPLQVGTVDSETGGVLTLSLPGGGTAQARGSETVGTRVFFKDGAVQGVAPSLPVELIDI